jgi:hypothetical protein
MQKRIFVGNTRIPFRVFRIFRFYIQNNQNYSIFLFIALKIQKKDMFSVKELHCKRAFAVLK